MSPIFISRNREQLGEFSEEEVIHGLMNGRFFASDLAWREGMAEWKPLGELGLQEQTASAPPPAAGVAPIGAVPLFGDATAARTKQIAWEGKSGGWLKRWWDTTIGGIFSPIETFSSMRPTGGYGLPLLYLFICSLVLQLFFTLLLIGFQLLASSFGFLGTDPEKAAVMAGSMACMIPLMLGMAVVSAAFGATVGAFLGGAIIHVCLMLFGAAHRGYEASVRAVCYSNGAIQALCLVPILGWIASILWGPVMYVIALKEAHQAEYWRVICAVLVPWLLCCGISVAIFVAFAGTFSQYFQGQSW